MTLNILKIQTRVDMYCIYYNVRPQWLSGLAYDHWTVTSLVVGFNPSYYNLQGNNTDGKTTLNHVCSFE